MQSAVIINKKTTQLILSENIMLISDSSFKMVVCICQPVV